MFFHFFQPLLSKIGQILGWKVENKGDFPHKIMEELKMIVLEMSSAINAHNLQINLAL